MQYLGDVQPNWVAEVFGQHDLCVFPTRGGNFGHVILESLSAGTPVIFSDRLSWRVDGAGGVTELPLTAVGDWADTVDEFARSTSDARRRCGAARAVAQAHLRESRALSGHRELFQAALHHAPVGG